MIKQVVKNEQELRDIIFKELSITNNSNKNNIDDNKIQEIIEEIIEDFIDEIYPTFVIGDLAFRLNGLDLFLDSYFESFSKKEIENILTQFNTIVCKECGKNKSMDGTDTCQWCILSDI